MTSHEGGPDGFPEVEITSYWWRVLGAASVILSGRLENSGIPYVNRGEEYVQWLAFWHDIHNYENILKITESPKGETELASLGIYGPRTDDQIDYRLFFFDADARYHQSKKRLAVFTGTIALDTNTDTFSRDEADAKTALELGVATPNQQEIDELYIRIMSAPFYNIIHTLPTS